MSLCNVTATFYLPASLTTDPEPAVGARLTVMSGTADGQVLQSTAKTYVADEDGTLEFFAPRLATIWLYAEAQGFGRQGAGVAVGVPDSATGILEIVDGVPVITTTAAGFLLLYGGGYLLLNSGGRLQLHG